ncbi:MAG: cofactor-independent phosphoglycerate mutase [Kiritimatiellae bacterium]|nr:cofactor-independent phosphoglycerate mutase [Kiritimatiellia bacterium]
MSAHTKTILFLGDGMADEPVAELHGRTPLQSAATPAMDRIAREGRSGTLLTLPDGFPTSSDVANMSVLGCDLKTELCGRGPLEAASQNIPLGPRDICFRVNLVSVDAQGVLRDFSGGHIAQAEAADAIALLNRELASAEVRFHCGVSYRNLLVLSGPRFNARVVCDKPDDNHGNAVSAHLPRALDTAGEATAKVLRELMARAAEVLRGRAANAIWPWSGGQAGAIRKLRDRYGIRAAVISAVDVINGLGRCLGMDVIRVPGATGYIDTNYEGKADAAIAAIRDYDFVYVHVEAMDEVSHAQDLRLKLRAIEDFDTRLVGRVMAAVAPETTLVVLPDHPVPLRTGKHTRTPVPVAVRRPAWPPDGVQTYDEIACRQGALGELKGSDLMDLLFATPSHHRDSRLRSSRKARTKVSTGILGEAMR